MICFIIRCSMEFGNEKHLEQTSYIAQTSSNDGKMTTVITSRNDLFCHQVQQVIKWRGKNSMNQPT